VVFAAVISILLTQHSSPDNDFSFWRSKSITRVTHSSAEENALQAAEHINFTRIFNIPRGIPANLNDYGNQYVAEYIDADVVNYYEGKFEYMKETPYGVYLNYTSNVSVWDGVQVVYVPPPENESIISAMVLIRSSNDTVLNEIRGGNGRYAYESDSGVQEIQETTIDFSFLNCFVVEMELGYGEIHGVLGAYGFNIYQTVIMDENFNPLFIRLSSNEAVA
jgi:hypothetical protein